MDTVTSRLPAVGAAGGLTDAACRVTRGPSRSLTAPAPLAMAWLTENTKTTRPTIVKTRRSQPRTVRPFALGGPRLVVSVVVLSSMVCPGAPPSAVILVKVVTDLVASVLAESLDGRNWAPAIIPPPISKQVNSVLI